jgi:hypothetical protein
MIETLPSIAAINNNYKIIKYLYEEGYYFEPIYFDAYSNYNVEVIEYLLENKCIGNRKFIKFYRNIIKKIQKIRKYIEQNIK